MDPADGATFAVKISGPVDIIPGIVSEGNGEYSCTFTPVKVELFAKEAVFVTCIICKVYIMLPSFNLLCLLRLSRSDYSSSVAMSPWVFVSCAFCVSSSLRSCFFTFLSRS